MSIPFSHGGAPLVTGALTRVWPFAGNPLPERALRVVNVLLLGRGGDQSQRWNQTRTGKHGQRRLLVAVQVYPAFVTVAANRRSP